MFETRILIILLKYIIVINEMIFCVISIYSEIYLK